jgi:crossover junction endodeoxyribonuclease RuvC
MTSPSPETAPLLAVPADCPWEIILGIDPGTRVLGYGALVAADDGPRLLAAGDIRGRKGDDAPERLATLRQELDRLLERLRPSVVIVESAFAARNVQSALRIGEARGVVLSCAAAYGADVVQYAPAVARKTLLGNGNASKEQTALMVATLLKLKEPPRPLDVTDALSLALAWVQRGRTARLLAKGSSKSRLQP